MRERSLVSRPIDRSWQGLEELGVRGEEEIQLQNESEEVGSRWMKHFELEGEAGYRLMKRKRQGEEEAGQEGEELIHWNRLYRLEEEEHRLNKLIRIHLLFLLRFWRQSPQTRACPKRQSVVLQMSGIRGEDVLTFQC